MGTREHIIAYLSGVDELFDPNGMASTQLAAAVGYPGSSVAFAQLLSGMERSGLIEREVRGKRTYRISLGATHAGPGGAARLVVAGAARASGVPGTPGVPGAFGSGGASAVGGDGPGEPGEPGDPGGDASAGGFDYDELARRLLVQVIRRLAAADPETSPPDRSAADRSGADRSALQATVTGLEYELAAAWTKHGKLAEENVRLRDQLKAAQRALAQAAERVRSLPVSSDLDSSEVVLLQRLLAAGGADSPEDSGDLGDSGQGGLAEAQSLLG